MAIQSVVENHLWFLMSFTPFFRLPNLFVRSTCSRFLSRSFKSELKWEGNRTCGRDGRNKAWVRLMPEHQNMGICFHSSHLARHNLFIDLDGLISKKRRVTSSHFIDKNSKCPPVHSFVVALKEQQKDTGLPQHPRMILAEGYLLLTFTSN